jgi:hypothetical protein
VCGLRVVVPHHKSSYKRQTLIKYDLPLDLTTVLMPYILVGWSLVRKDDTAHTLFFNKSGKTLTIQNFNYVFRRILEAECGGMSINPQRLRHAFVCWLRDRDTMHPTAMPIEAVESAAAAIMGNTVRMWNEVYHLSGDESNMQDAVTAMTALRASMDAIPLVEVLPLDDIDVVVEDFEMNVSEAGSDGCTSEEEGYYSVDEA